MAEDVTRLAIPVAKEVITAIFTPPLDPEQERAAAAEVACKAHELSEAVRVLLVFAAQHERTLAVETTQA